jgi:periplasmic copper chaperone A
MKHAACVLSVSLALCALPVVARAHVSVTSGPGFANATQEVTFGVAHGCAGADTSQVRIEIPASVTSARPMRSDFGKLTVEKDAAGLITAAVWTKADADVLDADFAYYKLVIRLKVPNQPFTTVFFPAHQTCRAADGTVTTTEWVALPTDPTVDGSAGEPAPALVVVPARRSGWNKFTVANAVSELGTFFDDALIVWKGAAAFSANPATSELIKGTAGVTWLPALAANDEIWVRY